MFRGFLYNFISLFLDVLGLRCSDFSSVVASGVAVHRLLIAVASLVVEQRL